MRSKILKSGNFCEAEAQNTVNPDGLTSILTKDERKFTFLKRCSDYSLYPKIKKIDELMRISQEIRIISYLQRLVNNDIYAKSLNISEDMQPLATEYLNDQNERKSKLLFKFIREEDFTVSLKG